MNYCVVSGKIVGEICFSTSDNMNKVTFNINNLYYSPNKSATEKTIIRCICYGALADYVNNELYEGANILVTGRVLSRFYKTEKTNINRLYIGCNTVTRLEQEEYC